MGILEAIREKIVFFDGGMGSLLQTGGLGSEELSETWNILHLEVLHEVHRDYLDVDCDVLITNTFDADGLKYKSACPDLAHVSHTSGYTVKGIVTATVENAKATVEEAGRGYITLDLGPTGKLLKPLGDLRFEEAYELYKEVMLANAAARADFIHIETIGDGYEAKAAISAAKGNCQLPVTATMTFGVKGKLLAGGDVYSAVALLEGLGVDALDTSCGPGPIQMKGILTEMLTAASIPVVVSPNTGLPGSEGGKTVYDIDADEFATVMEGVIRMRINVVSGCYGTTPGHIRKVVNRCAGPPQKYPEKKHRCVISSFAHAVEIGREPALIGEGIDPTGKSEFKQALREHNLDYILREGVVQQNNGAHMLDVDVGLPEIDEPSMMEEMVRELQSIADLPPQINTSDVNTMERAMRICNGKPLVNPVSGKGESMGAVLPLVKKYGGVVVALALDKSDVPGIADGQITVTKKIYERTAEHEIESEDILVDSLCLTVSSSNKGALTTLETVQQVREELGGGTILGMPSISSGLPQQEIINAAFFTMTLQNGLSVAIINPNSEAMMGAYYSFRALVDVDAQCGDYIRVYGGQTVGLGVTLPKEGSAMGEAGGVAGDQGASSGAGTGTGDPEGGAGQGAGGMMFLSDGTLENLKDGTQKAVTLLLETKDALAVISEEMIPALDTVGRGFEKGAVFLPQFLMSAEAAKSASEIIKERMARNGQVREKKGRIILATVKGDIHDIGKNIVKILLENYSYGVIDLNKDVPPGLVVGTVVAQKAPLVGLSTLMTITIPSMEETVRRLRANAPWAKVMVGGAVLTEDYIKTIGADQYCKDAMASVNYAESLNFIF